MTTPIYIFAVIGLLSFAAIVTVVFFALLNRFNALLNEHAKRRDSARERDRQSELQRGAWARFKCHRASELTGQTKTRS